MNTLMRTWLGQIVAVLVLLAAGTASAAPGFLSGDLHRGKIVAEAGQRPGAATVSGEGRQGCGLVCLRSAADCVVAPNSPQAQTLFRGERSSRTPVKVFEEGLPPKGTNADLEAHVAANLKDSNFIATSIRPAIAKGFAGKNGYVYVIRTERGIDVNATLGAKSPFPEQFEVAIPGGVKSSEVMGAFPMKNGEIAGEFVRNPGYQPRK